MQELIEYQNNLLKQVNHKWHRNLYYQLETDTKLLGIKGLRGVGKTTLMLQHLDDQLKKGVKALFITMEHPYFYKNHLFEFAKLWNIYGGKLLMVDEIHKNEDWSRELKLIYDAFPELRVIFTSSSALDLYRGEADLSRRLIVQTLNGMSFREYLSLMHGTEISFLSLEDILFHTEEVTKEILNSIQKPILSLFKEYLHIGYFPFVNSFKQEQLSQVIYQTINTVLESDLTMIEGFTSAHVRKIRKLLGSIAESVPFEPNISSLGKKLQLGRQTVNGFLKNLHDARILSLIYEKSKGVSQLQKPDKIYFENPNFVYAFQASPSMGTIRETFFQNQIRNAGHTIELSKKGDFRVNETHVFEVGGRNKTANQVKDVENPWLALDDIETGFGRKLPLWLFGFMY